MRAKVLLLLAVCMAVVIGAELPGSSAERGMGGAARFVERTADAAVGASIAHPDGWIVERERYSYDGTRGFKLWKAERAMVEDHGGTPEVRVALAPDLERGEIERRVKQRFAEYPDLRLTREAVTVGAKKLKGTAVGPIPGSTPYMEVYVPVEDRVYQINVYGTRLDDGGRRLLSGLTFDAPSRTASAASGLPDAADPATFYRTDAETERLRKREETARRGSSPASAEEPTRSTRLAPSQVPAYAESRIAEGCWRADSRFFVQTQHGYGANHDYEGADENIRTAFTRVGDHVGSYDGNFWGQNSHGNAGYGRCVSAYYVNDMYALDYPLNSGKSAGAYSSPVDVVFSPFKSGTVKFAGRNSSHSVYGTFVVIQADNGKYVNISAHLSGLAPGIRAGARVTDATVIGYAGDTGDPAKFPVGTAHLHQGFYRYPSFRPDGSPYGGQGLQVIYHHYSGLGAGGRREPAGVYQLSWPNSDTTATRTRGELIGN